MFVDENKKNLETWFGLPLNEIVALLSIDTNGLTNETFDNVIVKLHNVVNKLHAGFPPEELCKVFATITETGFNYTNVLQSTSGDRDLFVLFHKKNAEISQSSPPLIKTETFIDVSKSTVPLHD